MGYFVEMEAKNIGEKVKNIRKRGGFTRKELAELAGVGPTSIYELEKGTGKTKLSTLLKILTALNTGLELKPPFIETIVRD